MNYKKGLIIIITRTALHSITCRLTLHYCSNLQISHVISDVSASSIGPIHCFTVVPLLITFKRPRLSFGHDQLISNDHLALMTECST